MKLRGKVSLQINTFKKKIQSYIVDIKNTNRKRLNGEIFHNCCYDVAYYVAKIEVEHEMLEEKVKQKEEIQKHLNKGFCMITKEVDHIWMILPGDVMTTDVERTREPFTCAEPVYLCCSSDSSLK